MLVSLRGLEIEVNGVLICERSVCVCGGAVNCLQESVIPCASAVGAAIPDLAAVGEKADVVLAAECRSLVVEKCKEFASYLLDCVKAGDQEAIYAHRSWMGMAELASGNGQLPAEMAEVGCGDLMCAAVRVEVVERECQDVVSRV